MDYKQRMFYGIADGNVSKMPFYMAYPMQSVYMEELEYERDMRKLKDMYPKEVRSIQTMVEDECDKMEYEGSLMFDEYPDRLMLEMVVDRICQRISGEETDVTAEQYWGGMQPPPPGHRPPPPPPPGHRPPPPPPGHRPPPPPGQNNPLRSLVGVILNNEMYRRRCRHRRCRRWW